MRTIKQIIFGVFLISLVSSCNDKDIIEPTTPTVPTTPLAIGDSYQGGTIFYLDGTGQHGLIVAPKDDYNLILPGATRSFDFYVSGVTGNVGTQLQKVNFTITHQDVFNLRVKLKAPNGIIIQLAYNAVTVHGPNYTNTTIQTGFPTMSGISPPFTGTYSPDQAFSNLSSSTASGKWSIIIVNESTTYTAELINSTVTFNTINFPVIMKPWNNGSNILTASTGTVIGTGQANTTSIISYQGNGGYAAKECNDLDISGYTDWYLPSINELTEMYNQRANISGINTSAYYWSSSQVNATNAYRKLFSSGTNSSVSKSTMCCFRAIRSF
jgi:hypothetical protein